MDGNVDLEDVAAREWEIRERQRRTRAMSRPPSPPISQHLWLYLGMFSLVVHAIIVRAFTEPFMVHTALIAVGALISIVTTFDRHP